MKYGSHHERSLKPASPPFFVSALAPPLSQSVSWKLGNSPLLPTSNHLLSLADLTSSSFPPFHLLDSEPPVCQGGSAAASLLASDLLTVCPPSLNLPLTKMQT